VYRADFRATNSRLIAQVGFENPLRKMSRTWPFQLIALFCCVLFPGIAVESPMPMVYAAENSSPAELSAATHDAPASNSLVQILDNPDLPEELADLMQNSQSRYLTGSSLIAAGETDKARKKFDEAVNLLLQSDWDMASTPALKGFFNHLIQRIAEDESLYFLALRETEGEIETAVGDEIENLDLIPIEIDTALQNALALDLAETRYEIPIVINEKVMKALDYWLNKGRKRFEDGLIRSGRYRPMIERIFREESIPQDLIYLAQVESRFIPLAVSRVQAKGMWQFGKSTAIRYGLKITRDVDERYDPDKSTRAAARYLKDLYAMFNDWNLVLAAYNCGEGKIQRLINSSGLQDFWQLVDLRRKLPTETKNHVALIQASIIIGRNPGKYGFPTELDPPIQYAEVPVSKPINLRNAAKALGTSLNELRKLNPALKGMITPVSYSNYSLNIPSSNEAAAREKLAALPRATIKPPPGFEGRHKIQRGETLSEIAALYNVSIAELEEVNNLLSRHKIRAGSWLHVPSRPAARNEPSASSVLAAPASLFTVAADRSENKEKKTDYTVNRRSALIRSSER
jgi:membrane-bound lytic murein transglycosylase D